MLTRRFMGVLLCVMVLAVAFMSQATEGQFQDVSNWAAFDPGACDIGYDPDGYEGAVFDGRYVYFAPGYNGTQVHGEVLRYDTFGDFADPVAWAVYNPSAHSVGFRPRGYRSPTYDGRYVYFAPFHNGLSFHGEVLRYDTMGDFASAASWDTYDPGNHGLGDHPDGYNEAVCDGRYVYFAPLRDATGCHGEIVRYDTLGDFTEFTSWNVYDPGIHDVGDRTEGYSGAVFDGRYVYFVPVQDDTGMHGEVLRYDTTAEFSSVLSWITYDPGEHDVGEDPDGFAGAIFDGRYIYFVPLYNGSTWNGEVLRYDITGDFSMSASWTTYDPGRSGLGGGADGFAGGAFDGRYVYFVPHSDEIPTEDEVLRYDTQGSFTDLDSWIVFDPVGTGVGSGVDGRYGAAFDGRYVYFSPANFNQETHGEVLRYDTLLDCNGNGIHDECDLDCGSSGGWCDVPGCGQVTDDNGNGIPDECEISPDPPTRPNGEPGFDKNRYISFVPAEPGRQTALRVTMTSLPAEFSAYEGAQVWVGQPVEVCENSGQDNEQAPDSCGPTWIGGPALTMWSANLQADHYCHDFGSVGLLHVTDCEIVPGAMYTVQAIDCAADPNNEANYSDPLVISTSSWGNICGPWNAGNDRWSAPDTSVDIVYDVTACVDKFKNAPGAPIKPRADIDPNVPDWKINITSDVTKIIDAFGGDPYPFAGPGTCPP